MKASCHRTATLPSLTSTPAPKRLYTREEIAAFSDSDYAIHVTGVRARQRLLIKGSRIDAVHRANPSGGYQTTTMP